MKPVCLLFSLLMVGLLAACGGKSPAIPAHVEEHAHADAHAEAEVARTTIIAADMARASGIRVAPAQAGTIADEHVVQGLLTPVEGKVAEAVARYPGPLRELRVGVGDHVRAGQVVAIVHSNLSLSSYAVKAPIDGVVTARHVAIGAMAGQGTALLEIADLSTLWVDLHIFGDDAGHIRPGANVDVTRLSDGRTVHTHLERVLPGMATASQSTIARARIDNRDGQWRPGAAVRARVTVAEQPVDLMVPVTALQTMHGQDVVFVREGDTFSARAVTLGVRDAQQVQVVDGLRAGEAVVVAESYLIKADLLKQGAVHEH